jgi:glycosyltransferase involved in cell wall biosynthesis
MEVGCGVTSSPSCTLREARAEVLPYAALPSPAELVMASTAQSSTRPVGHTPLATSPTRILCIVPALNEQASIADVISDIHSAGLFADILVVDDGSTDNTREAALSSGAYVARMPFNVGIGGAVQTGLIWAAEHGYSLAVQIDGDGQHIAGEVETLLGAMQATGANVVIGSRFLEDTTFKSSAARRGGMRVLASLVSLLSRHRFTDTTSGFRLYDSRAIAYLSANYPEDYPEVEAILALCRAGFTVTEIHVPMRERAAGRSSITPFRSIYYMLKVTLALFVEVLRRKPEVDASR